MDYIGMTGAVAATFTTASFIAQVIRVHRTRHTHDLSMPMYLIFSVGVFLWMCYGFMIGSMSIILANAITLVLCIYILLMKMKYR